MKGKGKSKVLIKFLLNFRQSGDVLFFLNVRRLRGYTATIPSWCSKVPARTVNCIECPQPYESNQK